MKKICPVTVSKRRRFFFFSPATPGVPGDPGYMQLLFTRFREGRRRRRSAAPLVEMLPKAQETTFSLGERVAVNLRKGTVKIGRDEPDVAQCLTAAYAASVLYLLVQPRHANMALAATLTNGTKKVGVLKKYSQRVFFS